MARANKDTTSTDETLAIASDTIVTPEASIDATQDTTSTDETLAVSLPVYAVYAINGHYALGCHAINGDLPEGHENFMRLASADEIAIAAHAITKH